MWGYMWRVQEWSGLVLSGKDRSGGGSECHVTDHQLEFFAVLYTPPPIPSGFLGIPKESTWNGRNLSGFLGILMSSRWIPHGFHME